jgi:hypothetical protein
MTPTHAPAANPQDPVRTHTEVSRHRTSEGLVIWCRCTACGRLRALLVPDSPDTRPAAAGTRTLGCPGCF